MVKNKQYKAMKNTMMLTGAHTKSQGLRYRQHWPEYFTLDPFFSYFCWSFASQSHQGDERVEHWVYPCRSTLAAPACSEEKQKVCGICQLLCYTHQVAAFALGGLFLCTCVNLQIHLCIPQGKHACIPILCENQQSTESSTAELLILWLSIFLFFYILAYWILANRKKYFDLCSCIFGISWSLAHQPRY